MNADQSASSSSTRAQHIHKIGGIEVEFPNPPYGVQFSFMAKMITTLNAAENALLEAPTGSGKTLSLLCAALAWQKAKRRERQLAASAAFQAFAMDQDDPLLKDLHHGPSEPSAPPYPIVVPKIYFATRTHSQIAQVVKELKRTSYKPAMAVLAGRKHYCINNQVARSQNVDEGCNELIKHGGMGCAYKSSHGPSLIPPSIHDIEDLKKQCKPMRTCPYFASQDLAVEADLVFCPYSYLVDPAIRAAMSIKTGGNILIFDEAHNMEDVSREAASVDLTLEALKMTHLALLDAAKYSEDPEVYRRLSDGTSKLIAWLEETSSSNSMVVKGYAHTEFVLSGPPMKAALEAAGLSPNDVNLLWEDYTEARSLEAKAAFAQEGDAALEAIPSQIKKAGVGSAALGVLGRLLVVLNLIYGINTDETTLPPPPPAPPPPPPPAPTTAPASTSSEKVNEGGPKRPFSDFAFTSGGQNNAAIFPAAGSSVQADHPDKGGEGREDEGEGEKGAKRSKGGQGEPMPRHPMSCLPIVIDSSHESGPHLPHNPCDPPRSPNLVSQEVLMVCQKTMDEVLEERRRHAIMTGNAVDMTMTQSPVKIVKEEKEEKGRPLVGHSGSMPSHIPTPSAPHVPSAPSAYAPAPTPAPASAPSASAPAPASTPAPAPKAPPVSPPAVECIRDYRLVISRKQKANRGGGTFGVKQLKGRRVVQSAGANPRQGWISKYPDNQAAPSSWQQQQQGQQHGQGGPGSMDEEEWGQEGEQDEEEMIVELSLWCLNPAVVFKPLSHGAHSVILTSGTLSPLDTFASELGTEFKQTLEAPHVADVKRQVWAGVLPSGPDRVKLKADYATSSSLQFQDSVGTSVLRLCQIIPDGILLFVPSYHLMDKLIKRWQSTDVWKKLGQVKGSLVSEPKEAGSAFDASMRSFKMGVEAGRGALLIAVCKGKASEGIDFSDKYARGVLIVGIPFAAAKDTKVNLKKEFNNNPMYRHPGQKLVTGDVWYKQQAFRALNQALGRCIRHRYDYGAVVLLEERFRSIENQSSLSRWVRGAIQVHNDFDAGLSSLSSFFERIRASPPGPPAPSPSPLATPVPSPDVRAESVVQPKREPLTTENPMGARDEGRSVVKRGGGGGGGGVFEIRYEGDVTRGKPQDPISPQDTWQPQERGWQEAAAPPAPPSFSFPLSSHLPPHYHHHHPQPPHNHHQGNTWMPLYSFPPPHQNAPPGLPPSLPLHHVTNQNPHQIQQSYGQVPALAPCHPDTMVQPGPVNALAPAEPNEWRPPSFTPHWSIYHRSNEDPYQRGQ